MASLLFTGGYDDTINCWDISTGVPSKRITFEQTMNKMVISPDRSYLAVASNPQVKIWDLNSKMVAPVKSYEGHKANVCGIGISREGQYIYTCSEDGTAKTWEPRTCSTFRDISFGSPCNCIALHPNQSEIIVGLQDGRLCVWDTRNNVISQEIIPELNQSIQSVDITADGLNVAVLATHGKCFIYSTNLTQESTIGTLSLITSFEAHSTFGTCCKYSPNTLNLATASADRTIKIWKVKQNYSLVQTLNGHNGWVWDITFSNNSEYLISASTDTTAKLWDLKSGEAIQTYAVHEKGVVCLALHDKVVA
ncbi:WD domain, G-beta repeat containing protein [Entamoeba histolytica HM-1:IMSS-B]|uniref:Target of rapamycin complex subunit LST8 n=7 Tax=Entamoeba TaxID=5758 RepID=S0B1S0_ENTHI|nr:WD domain, G-beta repeat-containing protein [Entamoeba nuttalli P19]EMD48071.1 WD repeatcontaining protein pop3 [Entamoeba histolytica KU27]EMH74909.1 WD domain, G-beta repeat containing protein [Entamoeba histolytica HM-1:IMSS-B]EMS15893.1 WD repeat-containing protein pop3, putative [Entamoeba histolytica HM-3:IMSS]ENY62262.1 WD repeat-containing protein pop3 [Entamoeba histolytica HM-1:IMSS-A]BAN39772.1 WD repeat-containing protein [Entamoeba histolytica]|eukprot:XP_008857253.1 WD domain, G-beta repeat-containing protein [Entamoeba nuttalli P19]